MDKIDRIKKIVETSLNSSFGGEILIESIQVLPTQKYDESSNEWIPDSFSIFLNLKDKRNPENKRDYYHFVSDHPSYQVSTFLESLLGFECCVDFV